MKTDRTEKKNNYSRKCQPMSVKTIYLMDENVWLPTNMAHEMSVIWVRKSMLKGKQDREYKINHVQCGMVAMAATSTTAASRIHTDGWNVRLKIKSIFWNGKLVCSHFFSSIQEVFFHFFSCAWKPFPRHFDAKSVGIIVKPSDSFGSVIYTSYRIEPSKVNEVVMLRISANADRIFRAAENMRPLIFQKYQKFQQGFSNQLHAYVCIHRHV